MKKRNRKCILPALLIIVVFLSSASRLSARRGDKGEDRILSKITFIHYKKGHAKPPWAGGGGKKDKGSYTYLANGAKWKVAEDVRVNPTCNDGTVTDSDVISAVIAGMDEWETPDNKTLVIFGDNIITDLGVGYNNGDYREYNTISFGSYNNSNVIGITTVWGYFTGPPSQREIVEAHILMNDDYDWGDADIYGNDVMDLRNVLTHELGHWAGMGDLYESTATEETMYGYSENGETKKRDLYFGDIAGIKKLYK